jgi:hypothetical protein
VNEVPVTIWWQRRQITHPEARYVWELDGYTFVRPDAGQGLPSDFDYVRRLFDPSPIEIMAPAMSMVAGDRLTVPGDRDFGLPAELVFKLAMKGINGYSMAKKRVEHGPSLFDSLGPAPAQQITERANHMDVDARAGARNAPDKEEAVVQAAPSGPGPAEPVAIASRDQAPGPVVEIHDEGRGPGEPRPIGTVATIEYLVRAMQRAVAQTRAERPATAASILECALEEAGFSC